ncbi:histidine kinase [Micromonospora sp. WMMD1082]|uniref:sensor histidine kinase n=1 Tax=Micromonospora sp. WMMD1082 TaxID=3016104 RepID=UPI002417A508|nr:histidine kinase [Micromonospora sp. WMMD1082]MDG4795248.1 histidine kinase [Micromonospora sp. WMMD1082]
MTPAPPTHLAQALRQPRYLLTAWPWRALAYLLTTVPLAGVLSIGPLVVVAPLVAAVAAVQRHDRPVPLPLAVFLAFGALTVLALAPLLSAPVAAFERYRLGVVDERPLARQPWRGVAARYGTAAAWREAAYLFWLGGAIPVGYWLFLMLVLLDGVLIVSPFMASDANEVILIWATVDTPAQAVPHAIVGLLLAPVLWYAAGVLAAGQAAVARWLLRGADGAALREVTRSRARLVDAYEAERRRIERDLHDGAQPKLTSLSLQIGLARLDVPEDSPAARPLAVAHEQAKNLMALLRQIVRGIRPQSLTDLGLTGAVRELADESPVPVEVHAELPRPLPEAAETTAYFVVSEALGNVARHAAATRAAVRLTDTGAGLVVEISDDGRGGADPARGTGLTGLADRVAAADGRLLLASPPGGPTLLRVELPWSA